MIRAEAFTLPFIAIDSSNRPARKSALSIAATDIQISKDGGSFSNATNAASEIGSTGRYKVDLTAAEMDAVSVHVKIVKSGMDDVDVILNTEQYSSGSVVADGSNAAGMFKTDLASAASDHWKDSLLLFSSGTLSGQVKKIGSYNGSTKFVTLSSPFTATPSAGDRFLLINR